MQFLRHIVNTGNVLHLGISDNSLWLVSKANEYPRQQALTEFSVY